MNRATETFYLLHVSWFVNHLPDLTTSGVQVTNDITHGLFWGDNLDSHDRLQKLRVGLGDSLTESRTSSNLLGGSEGRKQDL